MSNKIIKIVEGDDNINVSVILNLTQLKALNNLLVEHNEEVPGMKTYEEVQRLTQAYALRSQYMEESVYENEVRENVIYLCDVIKRAMDEDISVTDAVERANVLLTISATNNLYESMGLLEECKLVLRDQFIEHAKNHIEDESEHFPIQVTVFGLQSKPTKFVICNSQVADDEDEEEYPNRTRELHNYMAANNIDTPFHDIEDWVVEDVEDIKDGGELWYVGN
jgi:hypothetical protein